MADYREQNGEGKLWRRCFVMRIENPLQGEKVATFFEEDVVKIGDNIVSKEVAQTRMVFEEGASFDIYDPISGNKTENTMSHEELYAILFSLYMTAATKRDTPTVSMV